MLDQRVSKALMERLVIPGIRGLSVQLATKAIPAIKVRAVLKVEVDQPEPQELQEPLDFPEFVALKAMMEIKDIRAIKVLKDHRVIMEIQALKGFVESMVPLDSMG